MYLSDAMTPPDPLHSNLKASVQYLKGIGPRKAAALEKAGIRTILDLFFQVPRRYLDRTAVVTIAQLRSTLNALPRQEEEALSTSVVHRDFTVIGEVRSFKVVGFRSKSRFVLVLADGTGSMQCVWFGGVQYWKKVFRIGERLAVSGQPSFYAGVLQFIHPAIDRISSVPTDDETQDEAPPVDWNTTLNTGGLVPLYPSGQELERVGLDSAGFRRIIAGALRLHGDAVPETLPDLLLRKRKLVPLRDAIRAVHMPKSDTEIASGFRRLKYEELFFFQLKLALKRGLVREETRGIVFDVKSGLARRLVDALPFSLTGAQVRVIREISGDMQLPKPMNRLLQGDVGSGKTVVALIAMLIAVDNGYQAVFMAPTEILAEQHFKTLTELLGGLPVTIRLLVGAQRSALRRDVLEDVRRGSAQIVVGTHALFEKNVHFAKLGVIIIDEQHRFGVMQRASLRHKGENPDVLVMTATPIPRTLSLTVYGDLDVSVIDEVPRNRKPVKTVVRDERERESVHVFVREQISAGRQAYFVYPLVEESETMDLKAATVHFEQLRKNIFPDLRLGLLHGRMQSDEKDAIMEKMKRREIDILVATTVIEVGIDIPNASVMVIENAERFGLAQLHQLRGRVGRGAEQSYCILLTKTWLARKASRVPASDSDERRQAEQRLATMVQTNDGFRIAEVDLQLRGPGDFFGTRQSGLPEFKVADLMNDGELLKEARADAFGIVAEDPRLIRTDNAVLASGVEAYLRDELSLLRVG